MTWTLYAGIWILMGLYTYRHVTKGRAEEIQAKSEEFDVSQNFIYNAVLTICITFGPLVFFRLMYLKLK